MASSPGVLSVRSARVKHARRLATRSFRVKTGEFLAEGPQAVREALTLAGTVIEVFATAEASRRHKAWQADGLTWHVVDDDVLVEIADSVQPQGIVARCRDLTRTIASIEAIAWRLVIVCFEIRDPGNLGAVIRVADAAGADAVLVIGDSVDPLNPKVVRSTAGSLFHLPIVVERDADRALTLIGRRDVQLLAADGGGEAQLFDDAVDLARPTAWLMGNEAHGLPMAVRERCDQVVGVPIYGRAESLNLATAAAVCAYASAHALRG
ncbi:TrmH family RNA methyltransferase [Aeromicrobium piscarium]|uniref:TrmH family RNA methyltransferase n=1 Tax=Aeromicrobium piscarium TaxID=2590901 RepID=UPI001FE59851|nr:RNA methyltransferase [Aeromicrobium piscarium]